MKNLLELPLRIATLPIIALLLVFQLVSSIIVGLASVVTNLLTTVFLFGSVAGWIVNAPSILIFQTFGLGIFFAIVPHIAGWFLEKATDLTLVLCWTFCWLDHHGFLLALFLHSAEQYRESARGA
ncbi:MAG: hypothetical protein ACI4ML_00435 [Aristaeellaceae bacterium]